MSATQTRVIPASLSHVTLIGSALAHGMMRESLAWSRRPLNRRAARGAGAPHAPLHPAHPQALADPPAWFRLLHANGPVNYCPKTDTWVLNGYHEVRDGARAHDVLSSSQGSNRLRISTPMLVSTDRPEHARVRKVLARDFTHQVMASMQPSVEQFCADALDRLLTVDGEIDFYQEFASPLPIAVIADIFGVPEDARPSFRRWSDALVLGSGLRPNPRGLVSLGRAVHGFAALASFFDGHFADRREHPREDVLSKLMASHVDGGLTHDELYWFCTLLLVAGNETTVSLLGVLALEFARDPGQWERLRSEPEAIPRAVEEGLRHASPAPAFFRTSVAPYQVAGVTIPAGSRVMLSFAAANRDPHVFEDPDRFDAFRERVPQLAFGHGIHTCLGAHLARMEAVVALSELTKRVARFELCGDPSWHSDPSFRGPTRIPLRLIAA